MNNKIDNIIRTLVLPFTESELNEIDTFFNIFEAIKNDDFNIKNFSDKSNELINLLSKSTALYNLGETRLYIKKFHIRNMKKFKQQDVYAYYDSLLSLISKIFLTYRDGQICLKYWTSGSEEDIFNNCSDLYKTLMWNALSRFISLDIIYIKFILDNNLSITNFYNQINLADAQLDNIISKGIAETHIHLEQQPLFMIAGIV